MAENREPNGEAGSRSKRVMASRALAMAERAAMARDFRERLTRELALDGSAAQEALLDAAVSARVEIAVIAGRFLRCCATSDEMDRLQRARGELNRTLRMLGVAPRSGAEPDNAPKLETWVADWRSRQKPQDGAVSADFDASGEEPEPS
jgi:hypothetical protein